MGYIFIKPEKTVDMYVEYASYSDTIVGWGTRADFEASNADERLLNRTDELSCSSYIKPTTWEEDTEYSWGGYGTVKRSQLLLILRLIIEGAKDDDPRILELVEPWEDDEE